MRLVFPILLAALPGSGLLLGGCQRPRAQSPAPADLAVQSGPATQVMAWDLITMDQKQLTARRPAPQPDGGR